ncbi:Uncharacterised protein [Serratia quinivorans]|nr:hypothetical protein 220p1_00060 [Serratia entomophila]CAI1943146.1 Uncharacterised protein [Serratia quinivorans]CAI2159835.1 Uncharacterised protein [Serratia quinivorans]
MKKNRIMQGRVSGNLLVWLYSCLLSYWLCFRLVTARAIIITGVMMGWLRGVIISLLTKGVQDGPFKTCEDWAEGI